MDVVVPTKEEVDKRYDDRMEGDVLGFEVNEYIMYMSFDKVRSITKNEVGDDELRGFLKSCLRKRMLDVMHDYMEFAWGKANDMRGLSSGRSIEHYIAWTWLSGDSELSAEIEKMALDDYCYYGKPILERICNFYGWDWKQWDDGVRSNG